MGFFARPDLSNQQFKQLNDSVLTLSGQTQIATISGLTLTDGAGNNIIVSAENASTIGQVLTYVGGGVIKLSNSSASGTSTYVGSSPASITVGGITVGTVLTGKTISELLEEILVPVQNPTLVAPTNTFTIIPSTNLYEVGTSISITANSTFDRGSISPVYCGGPSVRSGLPSSYRYTDFNATVIDIPSTSLNNCMVLASHVITLGNNIAYNNVAYSCGLQPKNSDGTNYCTPLPSGRTTPSLSKTITGIYPYFYGSSITAPVVGQSLVNGGSKCVGVSTGDIYVTNYNVTGQYIWFAIPAVSTSKTKWQGDNSPSNCGTIPGDLFGTQITCSISSPSSCWTFTSYKFYVSNYPTSINYGMTFKNS